MLDLGRSAAAELVADPSHARVRPRARSRAGAATRSLRLRNVSARRLTVYVATGRQTAGHVPPDGASRADRDRAGRSRAAPRPHRRRSRSPGARPRCGSLTVDAGVGHGDPHSRGRSSSASPRPPRPADALAARRSSRPRPRPRSSSCGPGRVLRSAEGNTVVPVLRLDVELWTDKGKRLGPAHPAARPAPRPLRDRADRPWPRGQAARARRLPAARLRLADRRRPADRAVGAIHDPVIPDARSHRPS